jgi:regulator of replication initiation timing
MRSACIFSSKGALFGLSAFTLLLAGCASEGDALDKRLAKLQEEVTRVQSENDRMAERLDAVELRQATQERPQERVASAGPAQTVSRPKLKVVKVESEGDFSSPEAVDAAPTEDTGPRVVISGEGKTLESRSVPATKTSTKTEPKADSAKKSEASKAPPKAP